MEQATVGGQVTKENISTRTNEHVNILRPVLCPRQSFMPVYRRVPEGPAGLL
jgi:hypothetical protein